MKDREFLDTNVLIYSFDNSSGEKQVKARQILAEQGSDKILVLSTQVLQEFYVVACRKLKEPLSEQVAEMVVKEFSAFPTINIDVPMIHSAISLSRTHSFSFWDALIVEAAARSGCKKLLSEDMQHGMKIRGLQIENPFVDITQKPAKKRVRAKKKS